MFYLASLRLKYPEMNLPGIPTAAFTKIRFAIALLAMTISIPAFTQNSLQGTVVDQSTGDPVFGASILISQHEKGSITSMDGQFTINNISAGSYQLVVSSLGYATRSLSLELPLETPLLIALKPSAIEMEEVIISTPFHRLQSENVVKVTRETIENLSRNGAVTLAEGITQLPGVESITTGAGIGKPVIRGLSSNRVLVYAQGVRLENQQYGDEHGLGISASGVESVEVIKGPASLLYGSDALGGVLYFNPEKYAASNNTDADAAVTYHSNTVGTQANAGIKTSGDHFRFLLRGNYAAHSDYETGDGVKVTNTRFEEIDIKTGVGYQDEIYRGDLRYNYNNSHTGIPEEIGEQSTSKKLLLPYQQLDNHILSFDNRLFFNTSSLDIKVGYLFNKRKEFEEHHHHEEEHQQETSPEEPGQHPALEMHLETLNYDLKYNTGKRGNFETIFGLQGMYQTNTNFGEELLIPDASVRDIGFLVTSHYHLEKIDFQGGLRFDNRRLHSKEHGAPGEEAYFSPLQREFTSYNGALGVKIEILPSLNARINTATGFRAPNLAELTANGSHEGTNRFEIGNPNLKNEQNVQLDVALELRNEHFEVFANGFYNKIHNYIYLHPTNEIMNEDPVFEYLQNDAVLKGGEAGFHIHPHAVHWLHIESSIALVDARQRNDEKLPLIPATSISNTLRVELDKNKWFENNYGFITVKSTLDQNDISQFETRTPGYTLLSAGVGGSIKFHGQIFGIRLGGSNLLNNTYISHLSRLKPEGIANQGRNISLRLNTVF